MAKKSMIQRELKRKKLVEKYAGKRAKLKVIINNPEASIEEKLAAQETMQKMPRDSGRTRMRGRCSLTGRPHGFYRKFGLGRNKLREAAMRGDVPGLVKASW